jgi:flagellar biosynthetic protein FliQ
MDADYFLTVAREAMWVLALASAPILIPACSRA